VTQLTVKTQPTQASNRQAAREARLRLAGGAAGRDDFEKRNSDRDRARRTPGPGLQGTPGVSQLEIRGFHSLAVLRRLVLIMMASQSSASEAATAAAASLDAEPECRA
jgi:hypothetical protein